MSTVKSNLNKLGIELPAPPPRGGLYTQVRQIDRLLFVSGVGISEYEGVNHLGKVGAEVSFETAQKLAEETAAAILAVVEKNVGLDNVKSLVKLFGMVQSAEGFVMQPQVINGASELFNNVFPESTGHVRMAVGTNQLPGNIPVEIETVFELA